MNNRRAGHLAPRLLIAVLVSLGAILFTPGVAQAHASLQEADPPADALLQTAPTAVSLKFNEVVSPVQDGITVVSPEGKIVQQGRAQTSKDGRTLTAKLRNGLPDGTYLVAYRLVSADGHPIASGYTFSVGQPSKTPDLPKSAQSDVDPTVRGALSVGRFASYVGCCLLVGAVTMLLLLWPRRLGVTILRRLSWAGWWALLGGTAVWAWAEVPYAWGGTLFSFSADSAREVFTAEFGIAMGVRVVALLAAIPVLRIVLREDELSRFHRITLGVLATAAAFTFSYTGHSASSQADLLSIPANALHVAAMSFWLGGLVVLAVATLRRAHARELAVILPTWSRWAMYAIATIAFTGTVSALLQVGQLKQLLDSTYGLLVLAKVGGLALVLVFAALARNRVLRWIRDDAAEDDSPNGDVPERSSDGLVSVLRRIVGVEIVIACVVLGLATALAQTPPGSRDTAILPSGNVPYTSTVATDDLNVQIDLDPARRGNNELHIIVYDRQGEKVFVQEWGASIAFEEKGIAPVDISLLQLDDNHATGTVYLPSAGDWKLRVTVRISDIDQVNVTRLIPVK